MSSRVTVVPGAQCPDAVGPGAHAWVNALATTTSPFTTAVLQTVALPQPPEPNQVSHTEVVVVPAATFGVQVAGTADTRPGSGTAALAGTTPNKTSAALMAEASIAPGTSRRMKFLRVRTVADIAPENVSYAHTRRLTYDYGLRRSRTCSPSGGERHAAWPERHAATVLRDDFRCCP